MSKKPQKRSVEYLLAKASDSQIRKLINDNGTIDGINANQLKLLLGYGKKQKLPEPKGYTPDQIAKIREHLKEKNLDGLGKKLQAIDLAEQSLNYKPESKQLPQDFRVQQEVMEKLIQTQYGKKPTTKQLGELASFYGIKDEQGLPLSLQEYQQRFNYDGIIRNENDLIEAHSTINNISNAKIKNEIYESYGSILTAHKVMGMKSFETQDEYDMNPVQSSKYHPEVQSRVQRIQERLMFLSESEPDVQNEGQIIDSSHMRAQVPIGIIEESKIAQKEIMNRVPRLKKKDPTDNVLADVKLAQKNQVRNGGQNGADLAVIQNSQGIETYAVKYPTLDEMLNLPVTRQLEFDLAQRKHLTKNQVELMQEILSTGLLYKPNVDFLRDEYKNKPTEENLQKYNDAIVKQLGKQVAWYGGAPKQDENTGAVTSTQNINKSTTTKMGKYGSKNVQDYIKVNEDKKGDKIDKAYGRVNIASKNEGNVALQKDLTKPQMLDVSEITKGIAIIVDYISKLSGNLNTPDLKSYKVENVFSSGIVSKKEPTQFKPMQGQGFKVRSLEC